MILWLEEDALIANRDQKWWFKAWVILWKPWQPLPCPWRNLTPRLTSLSSAVISSNLLALIKKKKEGNKSLSFPLPPIEEQFFDSHWWVCTYPRCWEDIFLPRWLTQAFTVNSSSGPVNVSWSGKLTCGSLTTLSFKCNMNSLLNPTMSSACKRETTPVAYSLLKDFGQEI